MNCSECFCKVQPSDSHIFCFHCNERNIFFCETCRREIGNEYNIDGYWDLERVHVLRQHKQVDLI